MSQDYAPPPPQKKQRGCFFYGCLISIILIVVGTIATVGIGYYVWRLFINTAKEYSETAPAVIPKVTMPEPEREALREKVKAFGESVEADKPTEPIILTAEDLNALIDDQPGFQGKSHVEIDGEKIKADISLPLSIFKIPELSDRYLNGSATLRVSLQNGILVVVADSVETKGKPLPAAVVQMLQQQNLAEGAMKNPKQRAALDKLESIQVKDGKVIVIPKKVSKPGDASKAEPTGKPKETEPVAPKEEPAAKPKEEPAPAPKEDPAATPKDATSVLVMM
jgi:ribonuclease D